MNGRLGWSNSNRTSAATPSDGRKTVAQRDPCMGFVEVCLMGWTSQ